MGVPRVISPADCDRLLVKASLFDGRDVSPAAIAAWHEAAVQQRWTDYLLCERAITDFYSRPAKAGDRLWIMPGHVSEFVRANARQPAQFDRAALEGPAPATAERRAALIARMAEQIGNQKSISGGGQVRRGKPRRRFTPEAEAS